jgi:excisionase family DNA binding protein
MQAQEPERKTVNIDGAARELGLSRNAAYEAARRGEIPTIRIGRRLLVPRAALDAMLEIRR